MGTTLDFLIFHLHPIQRFVYNYACFVTNNIGMLVVAIIRLEGLLCPF